ncbi:MAG: hypothetical protein ACREFX_07660, partial [Opitutaceae bacterium]
MADRSSSPRAGPSGILDRIFATEISHPDLGRGFRCMASFMAPLALGISGRLPVDMIYAAIGAQVIANVNVYGAYGARLLVLLAMTALVAAASGLGALAAHPLAASLGATVVIALGAGLWRHLNSDYGPSLATATGLVCYIALAETGGPGPALGHFLAAFAGGCWGTALHVFLWPIRPQHPLREPAGEAWLAAAGSCAWPADPGAEAHLREALDKAYAVLAGVGAHGNRKAADRIDELVRAGARLMQRVSAFQSAYEEVLAEPESGEREMADVKTAAETVFGALGNFCRSAAQVVVSRRPGHLADAEVRLRRIHHLLGVLNVRIAAAAGPEPRGGSNRLDGPAPGAEACGGSGAAGNRPFPPVGSSSNGRWATLAAAAAQIASYLPEVRTALRSATDRANDQGAFSLELADLAQSRLRPLASALNLRRRVDPALVRYT